MKAIVVTPDFAREVQRTKLGTNDRADKASRDVRQALLQL
jgi:hypothetical protein